MGQNISEQRNPKLHSDLFKKNGKVLFGKKKFTIPPDAERPSATSKPEVFQENEQFVLRWDPPATDGQCPIIGYIIEHLELGLPQLGEKEVDETTQWYSSEPGQVTNTECLLNNLIPGTTYQFRIVAENILGYSPPSEISDPIVYNPFGELDDYFCIPRFLTQLDNTYTVMRGEKLTLSVEVEGQPYPIVHWYDKNEMEVVALKTAFGRKRSLTFNSVDLQHGGKLTCNAENYMGAVSSTTQIVVQAPPHITSNYNEDDRQTPGSGAIFQSGELVRLKFNYSGAPSPTAHLYHNGELVTESERVSIEKSDESVVVKIANGRREDRGEYTIHLINDLGEDSASAMLTITDRPSPPVSKPEVLQLSDNSCVLQWRDPEDDGGCPVQNFIVEYFRDGWGVWLKAVTTKNHNTKIRDLIPGSKYKFRVKAENLYGVSEASDESVEILILENPSIVRSGDDGLMKTVQEEEAEIGDEFEELKPPPIPPRTRESSTENLPRGVSPLPPPINPITPLVQLTDTNSMVAATIPAPAPPPEKKLFSRREILGTPLNYLTLEPEIPANFRPVTPEKSPVDEELEKLKELLNEQSDYSEDDEEFSYDFEKLQKEYEEDMMGAEEPGQVFNQNEDESKRLPVFQEITDRWNTLTREMDGVIREYSVTRELEPETQQEEEPEEAQFDFDQIISKSLPVAPPPRFEKSPLRKFEIRHQLDKEEQRIPSPPPRPPFEKSPKRDVQEDRINRSIPEIRSFVPEDSPIRFIDSPEEYTRKSVENARKSPVEKARKSPVETCRKSPMESSRKSPVESSRKSPMRIPTPKDWSFEPEMSRKLSPEAGRRSPHLSANKSFEPENSPYRELARERSPMRSPRRLSPSHSLSPSPPPKRRSSDREGPLLHDRFTDYLTMKVKDRKIASSLTNIHAQSRSRSTSRPASPTRSSSSLIQENRHYESNKMRRDRTAELQQKYNTVDNRRVHSRDEESEDPVAMSKSYEYIDEVGSGNNLVVTECSLTVPVTLRPGSRIELWRSDSSLDNKLDEQPDEGKKTPEVEKTHPQQQPQRQQPQQQQPKEERKSRPRDYFKESVPPAPKTPEPKYESIKQEFEIPQPKMEVKLPEPKVEPKVEVKLPEPKPKFEMHEPEEEFEIPKWRQEFQFTEPTRQEFQYSQVSRLQDEFKMPEPQIEFKREEPKPDFKTPETKREFEFAEPKRELRKPETKVEIPKPEKTVEQKLPDVAKWSPEEEDTVDEEWLRRRRATPRRTTPYIRHYEEMREEEKVKVQQAAEEPKMTPEQRAEKARRARLGKKSEDRSKEAETKEEREGAGEGEEREGVGSEETEEEGGVVVAQESLLRRYYPTIIRTVLYMILSPLLLVSLPVSFALFVMILLSHYLQNKGN